MSRVKHRHGLVYPPPQYKYGVFYPNMISLCHKCYLSKTESFVIFSRLLWSYSNIRYVKHFHIKLILVFMAVSLCLQHYKNIPIVEGKPKKSSFLSGPFFSFFILFFRTFFQSFKKLFFLSVDLYHPHPLSGERTFLRLPLLVQLQTFDFHLLVTCITTTILFGKGSSKKSSLH